MLKTKEVTIYMCKSTRKNAKYIYKTFRIYNGDNALKQEFDFVDLYDVANFVTNAKKKGFGYARMCVYDDNFSVQNYYSKEPINTIEAVLNNAYYFMKFLNLKEFDFTLEELHDSENIRFHINNYYHN